MKHIKSKTLKCKERFANSSNYMEKKLDIAIAEALKKVDYAMETLGDKFPSHSSINNVYTPVENDRGWQLYW